MPETLDRGGQGTVLLVLDATPEMGVGHAIRCQALAEELLGRGYQVAHVGTMQVGWVEHTYRELGITMLGEASPTEVAARRTVIAVVLDSYTVPTEVSRALAAVGKPVLAIVDGDARGLVADLYLDQNLGATPRALGPRAQERALCGPRFALLRDSVRSRRARAWVPADQGDVPRVVVVFGGTDPAGGSVVVARALAMTGLPMDVTVVTTTLDREGAVQSAPWGSDQHLACVSPNPELVDTFGRADLVVTAAGSTVYELLALGRPSAVCTVAENQTVNCSHLVDAGLAVGLGSVESLRDDVRRAAEQLRRLLGDAALRAPLAAAGFATVDGRGPERVADRLLDFIG